jgi:PIN domain nuclease of toxin-antitoxin system
VRLLLDTHIALWAVVDSPRLSAKARELILAPATEVYVSAATIWEIAIKFVLGRGSMPISGANAADCFTRAGYFRLPMTWDHALAVESLPLLHADPFDRMLVAQSLSEPMFLLTSDGTLPAYGDTVLMV